MKHFSIIEIFIKKTLMSAWSNRSVGIKKSLGSLLIVASLTGLGGTIATEAHAPNEAEAQLMGESQSADANRAATIEKLAAEIRQIAYDEEQVLWLARILYSETKRSDEMPYIAWVVRNRVELGHRAFDYETGINNYKGAALAKSQFSGMHPNLDHNAARNLAMSYDTVGVSAWNEALRIAEEVYYADEAARVLDKYVTHFYSPYIPKPAWAEKGTEVYRFADNRFVFYAVL